MSGIEDQGMRPANVEPAPANESEESSPTDNDVEEPSSTEEPSTEDLREPSTEKDPGEEPKAANPSQPEEPSHEAVGIGIIGRPQTEMEDETE